MNIHIQIRITKDKTGVDKYTKKFVMDNLTNGSAYIKKTGALSFVMLNNEILGIIEHIEENNYMKSASVLDKKVSMFRKKMYSEIDKNRDKKRNIRRLYSFITDLIDKKIISSRDIKSFNEKWEKENHQ